MTICTPHLAILLYVSFGNVVQIGRLPGDWAKCLIPLTSGGKVKVEGKCRAAPEVLTTMDTVVLTLKYVSLFFIKDFEWLQFFKISINLAKRSAHLCSFYLMYCVLLLCLNPFC